MTLTTMKYGYKHWLLNPCRTARSRGISILVSSLIRSIAVKIIPASFAVRVRTPSSIARNADNLLRRYETPLAIGRERDLKRRSLQCGSRLYESHQGGWVPGTVGRPRNVCGRCCHRIPNVEETGIQSVGLRLGLILLPSGQITICSFHEVSAKSSNSDVYGCC